MKSLTSKFLDCMRIPTMLACLSLLSGCPTESPESVVESYFRAVEKGDLKGAYDCLTAQFRDQALIEMKKYDEKELKAMSELQSRPFRACGGFKHIEVKLQGEGEMRSGAVSLTFNGNCPPEKIDVGLIKENGQWKIDPI